MSTFARFFGIVTALVFLSSPVAAQRNVLLKHDDGSQETRRSMTGAGHAVRFDCPDGEKWHLTALSVYGSRYGSAQAPNEDFEVIVASDDLSKRASVHKPYSLFTRGEEKWVRFGFDPIEVEGAFHVAVLFNPTRTKGVYVGIDSESSPTHSAIVLASDPTSMKSDVEGDWMIRAYVSKEIDKPAVTLQAADARAEQQVEQEAQYDKEILGDARSLTLSHDEGTMDGERNIQGALYTVDFETPKNVEAYVWQVQFYASQFGGQHDSEAVSGDVYVLDENRNIVSRTTFPYSVATQQKQWISIPTLPTKVKRKFSISLDMHGTKYKGMYMGYREGNQEHLASTDERKNDRIAQADWSEKFASLQWMIRVKIADRPVVY